MNGHDQCRILIVEDHTDSAKVLALTLEQREHDVKTAHNGTEALAVAAHYRPHVAIIDVSLPGLDGYYVAREVRKAHPDMLLVTATGRSDPDDVERSRDAGCPLPSRKAVEVKRSSAAARRMEDCRRLCSLTGYSNQAEASPWLAAW
jgi:CheY-like chemotaxis protein